MDRAKIVANCKYPATEEFKSWPKYIKSARSRSDATASSPSPHTPLAVSEEWRDRSGLGLYADFVMETDALIGKVIDETEQSGMAENTLVIVTSDNGCAPYVGVAELEKEGHFSSENRRGYKASVWDGGHRIPFIARWPGVACGPALRHGRGHRRTEKRGVRVSEDR